MVEELTPDTAGVLAEQPRGTYVLLGLDVFQVLSLQAPGDPVRVVLENGRNAGVVLFLPPHTRVLRLRLTGIPVAV